MEPARGTAPGRGGSQAAIRTAYTRSAPDSRLRLVATLPLGHQPLGGGRLRWCRDG